MGEEFQGGVCGGKRWNPPQNLFSGGWSPLCSVAQLGGTDSDISCFDWLNDATKGIKQPNIVNHVEKNNTCSVFDDNSIIFPVDMDSTLDSFFGFNVSSSSSDCNQVNLLCKDGGNEMNNMGSILQDETNQGLCYGITRTTNSQPTYNIMSTPNNFSTNHNTCTQNGSPPMALSNNSSSGESSTITGEGLNPTFDPMTSSSSSTSYLIQTLFDDVIDHDSPLLNNNNGGICTTIGSNNVNNELVSSCSWINTCPTSIRPPSTMMMQMQQRNNGQVFDGGMSVLINGGHGYVNNANNTTISSNMQASLLNSLNLQSRSRAPPTSIQQRSQTKVNSMQGGDSKSKNSEQTPANKKAKMETPSPLPTFKVRKEKLGDRITALQQLVSPFGKTDTASVLHEAIEYIKFLHDQVNALSTPYLKNGAPIQQHQKNDEKSESEETKPDLRSRGLCLVPISSTYPVAQETPVDFWTPTFGGTTFR